jgi:hypothetical protein
MRAQPVQMDRKCEVRAGLEQVDLLLDQQRVGAQVDELPARDQAFDDLGDVLVDQRLAARNRHHRGAALIGRSQAFLDAQAPIQDRYRIIDLAAPGARQIAPKQRLQHQHQRISVAPAQPLLEHVGADPKLLAKRDAHDASRG